MEPPLTWGSLQHIGARHMLRRPQAVCNLQEESSASEDQASVSCADCLCHAPAHWVA